MAAEAVQAHTGDAEHFPTLTGRTGMDMINEMFQRQARRLEGQLLKQLQDRKTIEFAQSQLAATSSHVQWHTTSVQQQAQRLLWTEEAMQRVQVLRDFDSVEMHAPTALHLSAARIARRRSSRS